MRRLRRRYGHATKRGVARRERHEANLRKLEQLVRADAYSERPRLRVGKVIGRGFAKVTVTRIGAHTVGYATGDGYSGSIQVPFVGSSGEQLPAHRRALREIGESA